MADTIGTYYFQLAPSTEGIGNSISEALGEAGKDSGKSFSNGFGKVLGTAGAVIGGITTAISGVGSALVNATSSVAEYGDNIDKMSQKLGISAEAYQEWDAVMQHSGSSIDGLKMGIKTLNESLVDAKKVIEETDKQELELEEQLESGAITFEEFNKQYDALYEGAYDSVGALGDLGFSLQDIWDMTENSDLALEKVITALQGMPEGAERAALANDVLGRSAMDLGALFNTSAEDTQAMRDRVHELGGVMSDEAVDAAAAFQDQLQDMQTASQSLVRNMTSEFLPELTMVMSGLTNIFSDESYFGSKQISIGIKNLLSKITDNLSSVMDVGSEIVLTIAESIVNNLPAVVKTGMEVLQKLILGITSMLPQAIGMGISVIVEIINGISEAIPVILPDLISAILLVVEKILENLPTILSSILNLINILVDTILQDGLPLILDALPEIISGIVGFIVDSSAQIISATALIIQSLAEALPVLINELIPVIPEIVLSIIDVLISCGPELGAAFIEILSTLFTILPEIITGIWSEIPKVGNEIIEVFKTKIPEMKQTALDSMTKFLEAMSGSQVFKRIGETFSKIWEKFKENFQTILDGAKTWGANILQGFIDGIKSKISSVTDAIGDVSNKIASGFKDFFGIASPSKLFEEYGGYIDEGFAEGILGSQKVVESAISDLNNTIVDDAPIGYTANVVSDNNSGIYGLLAQYLPQLAQGMSVNVSLEADANGLLKLVAKANEQYKKQTGGRSAI